MTPSQVARRYGVSADKVLAWIRAGELRAINVAVKADGSLPRYRIDPTALADFERERAVKCSPHALKDRGDADA